jgi:hypothetical protein
LTTEGGVQYSKIAEIKGPLVVVDDVENAAFDELVEIETTEGEKRLGKVLEVGNGKAIVQVFEGLKIRDHSIRKQPAVASSWSQDLSLLLLLADMAPPSHIYYPRSPTYQGSGYW